MSRTLALVALLVLAGGFGTLKAQMVVAAGVMVSNQRSTVTIENPNTTGTYVVRLPEVPHLEPGETMLMQLRAVGTTNGAILTFEAPGSTVALTRQPMNQVEKPAPAPSSVNGRVDKVVHTFFELDIPVVPAGEGAVVRVSIPGVRAGAAITVSPAGEMVGSLHPAYAWAPIDCVVLIKFINGGSTPADLEPMQFGLGAINPD
jgi:hypothetical protein